MSAAVVLVLLTGTVVSSFFWFQSEARHRNLLKETKRANAKADEARLNLYVAHRNQAQRNWEIPKVGLVLDFLEKTQPQPGETDLRGFEWHDWNRLAHSYQLNLQGHTDSLNSVTFSADGKRLASASLDGTVNVWDARPWTPELRAEREALTLLHFLRDQGQPQSECLAALSADQTMSPPRRIRPRALQFARDWKP